MYSVRIQAKPMEWHDPVCRHCFNHCGTPEPGTTCCPSCAELLRGMNEQSARGYMRPLAVIGVTAESVSRFGDIEAALSEVANALLVTGQGDTDPGGNRAGMVGANCRASTRVVCPDYSMESETTEEYRENGP